MTKFESIYSLFLATIQDYHISKLFETDLDIAEDLLQTFLIRAVHKFKNCIKPIQNLDLEAKSFNTELDINEINILSDLMVLSWLEWNNNNILQMNFSLNDNDFRHYSEEKNLKEKTSYTDRWREEVEQEMVDYGLYRTPFKEWAVGNYEL